MPDKPSIGRIVHYVSYGTPGGEYGKECRAAIVTEVDKNEVGLAVLNPTGVFFKQSVEYHESYPETPEENEGGTWHWPERTFPEMLKEAD